MQTKARFCDVYDFYDILRNKLNSYTNLVEVAKHAVDICTPYSQRFVRYGLNKLCCGDEIIVYLLARYNFHQSMSKPKPKPLIKIIREFNDKKCKSIRGNFSSNLNSYKNSNKNLENVELYNMLFPNDLVYEESRKSWCTSIYQFMIKSALIAIPSQYVPFIDDNYTLELEYDKKNEAERLQSFINHFYLAELEDSNSKNESFFIIAEYLLERLSNANLINALYNKIESTKQKDWLDLSILSFHPLLSYRCNLIDIINVENDELTDALRYVREVLYHQIFIYLPLLCRLFDLFILILEERDIPIFDNVSHFDKFRIWEKLDNEMTPKQKFPKLDDDSKVIYGRVKETVFSVYKQVFCIDNLPDLIYTGREYTSVNEYRRLVYGKNSVLLAKINNIISTNKNKL